MKFSHCSTNHRTVWQVTNLSEISIYDSRSWDFHKQNDKSLIGRVKQVVRTEVKKRNFNKVQGEESEILARNHVPRGG